MTLAELEQYAEFRASERRDAVAIAVTTAWYTEAFARQKRLDPLERLLEKIVPKPEPMSTLEEVREAAKAAGLKGP